jgi:hypothetical protein
MKLRGIVDMVKVSVLSGIWDDGIAFAAAFSLHSAVVEIRRGRNVERSVTNEGVEIYDNVASIPTSRMASWTRYCTSIRGGEVTLTPVLVADRTSHHRK